MMTTFQAQLAYYRRELTLDQLLAGIADGTIYIERPTAPADPNSPHWYDDVSNTTRLPPFRSITWINPNLTPPGEGQYLTRDEYEQVRKAIADKQGIRYLPLPKHSVVSRERPAAPQGEATPADEAAPAEQPETPATPEV